MFNIFYERDTNDKYIAWTN